jgi:anthranilate phosphoribosyltransferase
MLCAAFIKEIGRGKDGARSLTREQATALWAAILAGEVSDLELGAVLLALRIKGESLDELSGFLDATHAAMTPIALAPSAGKTLTPVVIPTYNGARHLPNMVPLLAMLLAERGLPVLVHGLPCDPMAEARAAVQSKTGARVTTAEVFDALGVTAIADLAQVPAALASAVQQRRPVFVPVQVLAPKLARILALRPILGVRNSGHTLCKLLQPFSTPALRLASYTHPEYAKLLADYFLQSGASCLLSRGTEGETVANPKRAQRIDWYHDGLCTTVVDAQDIAPGGPPVLPESRDAATTAVWTQSVLAGERPVPETIDEQVSAVCRAVEALGVHSTTVAA